MSPERAHAYRRVTQTLRDLGPAKLQDEELDTIREAADALIFAPDPPSDDARQAFAEVEHLCQALVDSGRWEGTTAARLLENVAACGPGRSAQLKAA
jgi:hypothetical protein